MIRNRNFTNEEEDDGKGIISQKRNPIDSRRETEIVNANRKVVDYKIIEFQKFLSL